MKKRFEFVNHADQVLPCRYSRNPFAVHFRADMP